MTRKQRRLILIGSSLGVLAIAAVLVLSAMSDSIVFFNSPTDIAEKHIAPGTRIRVGGLVKPGSVQRGENLHIRFEVTDGKSDVTVRYQGIVPDLFREGQGVVTEGKLEAGGLMADMVLGERDKAQAAAADAKRALASDADKLRQIDDMIKSLGLEG